MKRALVAFIFAAVIAAGVWGIWVGHNASSRITLAGAKPVNLYPAPGKIVMSQNWKEFRAARVATFKDNPDLAAGYKQLLEEMADQQKEMDVAMIKADPKAAPIITKLALAIHTRILERRQITPTDQIDPAVRVIRVPCNDCPGRTAQLPRAAQVVAGVVVRGT